MINCETTSYQLLKAQYCVCIWTLLLTGRNFFLALSSVTSTSIIKQLMKGTQSRQQKPPNNSFHFLSSSSLFSGHYRETNPAFIRWAYALGFNNKQLCLIPQALEIHEDRCVGRNRGVLCWKMERLAFSLFALATSALFKASLITWPLYCRNIRHVAQSYLFSSEEPESFVLPVSQATRRKGCGCEHRDQPLSSYSILHWNRYCVFFTTAVAECIQCINVGLSLGAPDSRCVHFALFNDACWGDSGIPPLTSALSGPEPVSTVSMATGDTQPQWLETN